MASKNICFLFFVFASSSVFGQETCSNSSSSSLTSDSSAYSDTIEILSSIASSSNISLLCVTVNETEAETLLDTLELYLCYGATPDKCQIALLSDASNLLTGDYWNSSKESVLFVPGWTNSATSEGYSTEVIDAYARNGSYNLLILNWYSINNLAYTDTVAYVPYVSIRVASILDSLSEENENFSRLNFVGHSLGAHVVGGIARRLTKLSAPFLAALDPAGPLFYKSLVQCQDPVASTDADYVVALHSDWGNFGSNELVGDMDLMPNGGHAIQPGCTANDENPVCDNKTFCSHERGLMLWCDAVRRPGTLLARKCASEISFDVGTCADNAEQDITQLTLNYGTYFFTTNGYVPYGKGAAGI